MEITPRPQIIIADEDVNFARSFQQSLTSKGDSIALARSASEAATLVEHNPEFRLAFVDSEIPPTGAIALMTQLHRACPDLPVVIMSTMGTPEGAVEAIRSGAEDYLVKPFNFGPVAQKASRLLRLSESRETTREQGAEKQVVASPHDLLHGSHFMQQILGDAVKASQEGASILLVGECGVGKDVLARAIHAAGSRAKGPFLLIDCRLLGREGRVRHQVVPDRSASSMSQRELQRTLKAAIGGTLCLSDVGELSRDVQDKLVVAIGTMARRCQNDGAPVQRCPHILSSTSRPLAELRRKYLHEALYSLIAGVALHIPPLRDRREDIIPLIEYFLARLGQRYGHHITLGWSSLESLVHHPFPGKVRELESILERAAALAFQTPRKISSGGLRSFLPTPELRSGVSSILERSLNLKKGEQLTIERALRLCRGNRSKAAALLGIDRTTLYHKLERLNGGKNSD